MKFIASIAYFMIFGKPVIMYMGIITLLSFIITALIGFMSFRGMKIIPFRWHPRMAIISITFACIHALLAASLYFIR